MKTCLLPLAACLAAVVGICGSARANLVQNGDFGTGNFTDWTLSGNVSYDSVQTGSIRGIPGGPNGDTYYAYIGPYYPPIYLSQSISTTVGDDYTLSFYVIHTDGDAGGSGPADAGGAELTGSFGGDEGVDLLDIPITSWTEESFTIDASSTTESISFSAVSPSGYYGLGDISVVNDGPSGVPDGGVGLGLTAAVLAGLCGYAACLRRRQVELVW